MLLRCQGEWAFTLAHHYAVFAQPPLQPLVVRLAKQVFAADLDRQRLALEQPQPERLLGPLGLKQGGMRGAVRKTKPLQQNWRSFGVSPKSPP